MGQAEGLCAPTRRALRCPELPLGPTGLNSKVRSSPSWQDLQGLCGAWEWKQWHWESCCFLTQGWQQNSAQSCSIQPLPEPRAGGR